MRHFHCAAIAAATLLTASAAFAQTGMTVITVPDAPAQSQGMNDSQRMNDADMVNRDARAPATLDNRRTYDSSMPADRSTASGMSGTSGNYAGGTARYGNQYDGASTDAMNGSGHYAAYAHGSQLDANNVHATPQPGALNNQLYRGN